MSLYAVRHERDNSVLLVECEGEKEAMVVARDFPDWTGRLRPQLLVLGDFDTIACDDTATVAVVGRKQIERRDV